MPTVLHRDGFRVVIWLPPREHGPAHVHVFARGGECEFWIAPGSVITDDVPAGSLAGFAPRQETKEGWVYEKHGKPDR